jgi:Calcineurin-like phosphoesterase
MAKPAHFATAIASFVLAAVAVAQPVLAADPVVFRFATMGDSRQDLVASKFDASYKNLTGGTPLPQDLQWGQATKVINRILKTVQSQKANLFFENGDMIMGYGRAALPSSSPTTVSGYMGSDLGKFYTQYAYWRGLVSPAFDGGTYVVPVPGNHETQCSSGSNGNPSGGCASGKKAYSENEDAWRANMGDLIADLSTNQRFSVVAGVAATNVSGVSSGAPTASTNNGTITGDQTKLTYSFDIQSPNGGPLLHFAIINTDPSGADGVAPSDWLANDFQQASGRGATKFYVFGHKPAFTYYFAGNSYTPSTLAGLDANATQRNQFWKVVAQYNATYFCGHEHTYNVARFADQTGTYTNQPYQVLVGTGGSPFEMTAVGAGGAATDRYYAWALVEVHQSGAVTMSTYGFNENLGPTQNLLNVNLP